MRQLTITINLPPKHCHKNRRHKNAFINAQHVKLARQEACYRTLSAMNDIKQYRPPQWKAARGKATWYVKTKARRDPTNLNAALAATLDGIVQAGLLKDDDKFHWDDPVVEVDKVRQRVEILITREGDDAKAS